MNNHARNQIESVQALSLRQLSESGQDDFANALDCFNKKVWRSPRSAKPARYNLAILYDPDENSAQRQGRPQQVPRSGPENELSTRS